MTKELLWRFELRAKQFFGIITNFLSRGSIIEESKWSKWSKWSGWCQWSQWTAWSSESSKCSCVLVHLAVQLAVGRTRVVWSAVVHLLLEVKKTHENLTNLIDDILTCAICSVVLYCLSFVVVILCKAGSRPPRSFPSRETKARTYLPRLFERCQLNGARLVLRRKKISATYIKR